MAGSCASFAFDTEGVSENPVVFLVFKGHEKRVGIFFYFFLFFFCSVQSFWTGRFHLCNKLKRQKEKLDTGCGASFGL